jgi:hypothetical protein
MGHQTTEREREKCFHLKEPGFEKERSSHTVIRLITIRRTSTGRQPNEQLCPRALRGPHARNLPPRIEGKILIPPIRRRGAADLTARRARRGIVELDEQVIEERVYRPCPHPGPRTAARRREI